MRIKDLDELSRPREKAWRYGIESLTDIELLAVLIGSGVKNKSALEIADDIYQTFQGLKGLEIGNLLTLEKCEGLSKIKALKLKATFELARRLAKKNLDNLMYVQSIDDIYKKYHYLETLDRENFILVLLNGNNKIIKEINLYKGTNHKMPISLKDVITELLVGKANKFLMIHNHPNGNKEPSDDDLIVTELLIEKAKEFEIEFFDHIIIYPGGYYSFKNECVIEENDN